MVMAPLRVAVTLGMSPAMRFFDDGLDAPLCGNRRDHQAVFGAAEPGLCDEHDRRLASVCLMSGMGSMTTMCRCLWPSGGLSSAACREMPVDPALFRIRTSS